VIEITGQGGIIVDSKLGLEGRIQHDMYADRMKEDYGEPIIYHTDRGSNDLLEGNQ
jgi:hypothetical protein